MPEYLELAGWLRWGLGTVAPGVFPQVVAPKTFRRLQLARGWVAAVGAAVAVASNAGSDRVHAVD